MLIFALKLGVVGAALATVVSQAVSAVWVLRFLTGKRVPVRLTKQSLRLEKGIVADISKLGTANFIMQGTTCLVQIACNKTLQQYGGDLYAGRTISIGTLIAIFLATSDEMIPIMISEAAPASVMLKLLLSAAPRHSPLWQK